MPVINIDVAAGDGTPGSIYPCQPWPIDPRCCPGWPTDPSEWSQDHFDAQWLATTELWRAVAGAVGICRTVELPCLDACAVDSPYNYGAWMTPWRGEGGAWFNNGSCGCLGDCTCGRMCTVTLQGPVASIESVTVDGVVLAPTEYKLLTANRVARCGSCWPACQDYCAEDGLVVTYMRGVEPGIDAIRAVSLLACRKLLECGNGGGDCGTLPSGVTSIQREGLSMQLDNTIGAGDNGTVMSTGIARVDRWIASLNPYGITDQASVWSPDVPMPQVWRTGSTA